MRAALKRVVCNALILITFVLAAQALAEQPQAVTLAVLVQRTQSDVVVDLAPPLTLDAVKRKRKRKMNKHKRRKRRKRDRMKNK